MTILFYSPFNNRSRDTESLMIAFKQQGNRVISLSQAEGKYIHPVVQAYGIEAYSHVVTYSNRLLRLAMHLFLFIRFCSKKQVDVVYSHLEPANSIAAIGQYLIRARVFICRHHIDEATLQGFNNSFMYKLTYKLAKRVIVVSDRAITYMKDVEGINPLKISRINLAYDFNLFPKADVVTVNKIRSKGKGIMLLTISRLTKYKRVSLAIQVLKQLHQEGIEASLFILGQGEDFEKLQKIVRHEHVEHAVFFEGYVLNTQDYLAAADFLVHPSVLESSCVSVKEAAISELPVIVCSEVGDFDDYLIHQYNGYKVTQDNFVKEAAEIIRSDANNKSKIALLTERLKPEVINRFGIENIIGQYKLLNSRD